MHLPMEVDGNPHAAAYGLSHCPHPGQHPFHVVERIDIPYMAYGIHLHRRKARGHAIPRLGSQVSGGLAADPGVDPHLIAYQSAEELIDRHLIAPSLEIPQCLIDAGNRAHQHGATAVEAPAIEQLPYVFDPLRILSDEERPGLLDRRGDGIGVSFDDRLAPAGKTVIRSDLEE
jgi:hypothetical protein